MVSCVSAVLLSYSIQRQAISVLSIAQDANSARQNYNESTPLFYFARDCASSRLAWQLGAILCRERLLFMTTFRYGNSNLSNCGDSGTNRKNSSSSVILTKCVTVMMSRFRAIDVPFLDNLAFLVTSVTRKSPGSALRKVTGDRP